MSPDAGTPEASAGRLLKAARERQGVHIAALAAALKVAPRKLEALEADRFDEFGDATFVRALAQSVCRVLRVDPQPVLALLPRADPGRLEQISGSLNTPFRDRSARDELLSVVWMQRALVLGGAVLLVAALLTYFVPSNWLQREDDGPATAGSTLGEGPQAVPSAASVPVPTFPAVLPKSASSPASSPASSAAPAPAPGASVAAVRAPASAVRAASSGVLWLSASGTSWVEVRDRDGRVLLSRTLRAGEVAELDADVLMRAVIGNASAVQLKHRGQDVPLGPATASNVARLELP